MAFGGVCLVDPISVLASFFCWIQNGRAVCT
jgi:hypothetical protein